MNVSRPTGNRTGLFPDALPLLKARGSDASASVNLRAGVTTAFWVTTVLTDDVAKAQARGGCDVQGSVEARAGSESLGRLPLCITARSFSGPCYSRPSVVRCTSSEQRPLTRRVLRAVANRTLVTDSAFNGLETHAELAEANWTRFQKELYAGEHHRRLQTVVSRCVAHTDGAVCRRRSEGGGALGLV